MMLWGALYLRRRYSLRQYACVCAMVVGLVVFLEADAATPVLFSATGVALMVACVLLDCFYSLLSELVLARYDASPEEVSALQRINCLQ
jgi:drug/metabolite transporter (DMT)-like permease